jgi:tetratricopeptide (TPR) repeat protein
MADPTLDLLLRPYRVLHVLMYLRGKGEATVSEIRDQLGLGGRSYAAVVTRLLELGFVYQREERTFPKQVFIGLTIRGKRTADSLQPAANEVKETFIGFKSELEKLEAKERTEQEEQRILEVLLGLTDMEFTMGVWGAAESHARKAHDLASGLKDEAGKARSLSLLGEIHYRKGAFQDAEKEFAESLTIHTKTSDDGGRSEDHYFLGSIKEKRGDLAGARREFEDAMTLAGSVKDDILKARADLGIGRIMAKEGRYADSYSRFKESIETFERLEEVDELPRAYANAGSSTYFIDVEESLKWHEKCIGLSRMIGDARMLGYGLSNAAGCYIKKKENTKALRCLDEASDVFKELDEKGMLTSVSIQYGLVRWQEGKWAEAENQFFEAMDIAKKHGLSYELGDALMNCGLMNLERGQKQMAESQLRRAMEIFEKLGNQAKLEKIMEGLKQLSR